MKSTVMMLLQLLVIALSFPPSALSFDPGMPVCPTGCKCGQTDLNCRASLQKSFPNVAGNYSTLDFVHCKMETIHIGAFNSLPDVTSISLQYNSLISLSPGIFQPLTKLTYLSVEDNKIVLITSQTFDQLILLEKLYLNYNRLTGLPDGLFGKLVNLETLDLDFNFFTSLEPGTFNNLKNLEKLSLRNNKITQLDVNIFNQLTALTTLNLNSNKITILRVGVFDKLTQLGTLDVSGNQISDFTLGIFDQLTRLSTLNMDRNPIQFLRPGIFDKLRAMHLLGIGSTHLTALTPGLFNTMTNLIALMIYSNPLSRIDPGTFDNLARLTHLEMRSNNLTALPSGVFDHLPISKMTFIDFKLNKFDLSRSICALSSLSARVASSYELNLDDEVKAAIKKAKSIACKSGPPLCFSINDQHQKFFCPCPSGQTYTGSRCVPKTSPCTPDQVPPCVPTPVCVSRQSVYDCTCPFGTAGLAESCRRIVLVASHVTTRTATIHVAVPETSIENPGRTKYVLQVKSTFPTGHNIFLVVPMMNKTAFVKDLRAGYKYEISVTNSFFQPVRILTQQSLPAGPTVVATSTSSSISVYFNKTSSPAWVAVEFCVTVENNAKRQKVALCRPRPVVTIKGLEPGALYGYSAAIVNSAGSFGIPTLGLIRTNGGTHPGTNPVTNPPPAPATGKNHAGAIIGGLLGAVVIVVAVYFAMRRPSHKAIGRSDSMAHILVRRMSSFSGGEPKQRGGMFDSAFFKFNKSSSTMSGPPVRRLSEV